MLTVVATFPFSCGCTEAIVSDDDLLFACSADVRGNWWCECCDGNTDPDVCEHAETLLLEMDVA